MFTIITIPIIPIIIVVVVVVVVPLQYTRLYLERVEVKIIVDQRL